MTLRRRLVRQLSTVLIVAGLLVAGDALLTYVWQEPLTAAVALIRRDGIDHRYLFVRSLLADSLVRRRFAQLQTPAQEVAFLAARQARVTPDGAALGELGIPSLGLRMDLVQGDSLSDLELGPAHYPQTALPGQGQTVAIAGHRTTYLAPFRNIDRLRRGQTIVLEMSYGRFVYAVTGSQVVSPHALWITRNVGYDQLVLSACTPLFSAAQRLVVFARLVAEQPRLGDL